MVLYLNNLKLHVIQKALGKNVKKTLEILYNSKHRRTSVLNNPCSIVFNQSKNMELYFSKMTQKSRLLLINTP